MGNSIFDDRELFSLEEGKILETKYEVIHLILYDILKYNVFKTSYLLKSLNITKAYFKLLIDASIYELSVESLKDLKKPAQQLSETIQLLQMQMKTIHFNFSSTNRTPKEVARLNYFAQVMFNFKQIYDAKMFKKSFLRQYLNINKKTFKALLYGYFDDLKKKQIQSIEYKIQNLVSIIIYTEINKKL